MKKMNFESTFKGLLLIAALILSSCGYVSDKPPVNIDVYKTDELQACKIDVSKLGEIFKADQKQQILCLQENFIQFTKYVRARENGSISETELNAFVRKFFQGQSDSIVKGLSLIFQLNMLLLKDEATKISRNNISPLFDLLVKVNQEAVVITQILKEMNEEENQGRFWELREKFNESVTRFSNGTIAIIDKSTGLQQKLNMKDFIIDAGKKLGTKEINPETIDTLIFLKRVLVGGEKEVITTNELRTVLSNLPKILRLCFDFYYVKNNNFATDVDHARFYLTSMNDIYGLIAFGQKDFQLFTIDQILNLASHNFNGGKDYRKFKPSIVALKSRLVGGDKESISLRDLKVILDIGNDLIKRTYFNIVMYNTYRDDLEKDEAAPKIGSPNLPQYDVFSKLEIAEFRADFTDTILNVHYFRSEKVNIPYYGFEYKRNKKGFLEASVLKWLGRKLIKGYGHKNAQGINQVNLEEFQTFLFDMRPVLEEFKLWSPNPETFARNAILLADLFQNKSNGDLEVNEIEATEYMQMILSAVEITDKISLQISSSCDPGINKEDPVFETSCFNDYFFDALLYKLDLKDYFPRLNNYALSVSSGETNDFLKGIEGFARDNPNPNLPINKRDSILVIGAMLNIESTFIRFDLNKDNLIDYRELMEAFKVYRTAIISIAKLKPADEVYAPSIFLYMVSKMEIPPTGTWLQSAKFGAFHKCVAWDLCRNNLMDKIEAKRLNIGKLLYYLVNQPGTESKGKKQ